MIITDKFIWFHLPKTGGTTFHYLTNKLYRERILFQYEATDPRKHSVDIPGEFQHIQNYIIGFRKLPSWIISHNRHHSRRYSIKELHLYTKQNLVLYPKNSQLKCSSPDFILNKYYNKDRNIKYQFIRQEFLLQDYNSIVGKYFGTKEELLKKNKCQKNVNKRSPAINLEQSDIKFLYEQNPLWASIEQEIY